MPGNDLVRPSKDGDQFHYQWDAGHCLELLPGKGDLVAVTIEGASKNESDANGIEAGEQLIDVALYYGSEKRESARLIRYIQLKHSTRHALEPWTPSGLKKTIKGFAARYSQLAELFHEEDVAQRFRFEFTTNRPIDSNLENVLADFRSGVAAQHPGIAELEEKEAIRFFGLFFVEGGEEDIWQQRNLLSEDITAYLPDCDYDAPIQLKELVTRRADHRIRI